LTDFTVEYKPPRFSWTTVHMPLCVERIRYHFYWTDVQHYDNRFWHYDIFKRRKTLESCSYDDLWTNESYETCSNSSQRCLGVGQRSPPHPNWVCDRASAAKAFCAIWE